MVDKVRIKKAQLPRIEQWCKVLEITESRFVEDAIAFYLRNLEGKAQINTVIPPYELARTLPEPQPIPVVEIDDDDPDNYDGGLDL